MSVVIGPTCRHAIEKCDGSSASPSPPLMPPVRAWLIWHATPGTFGSSNALTHPRSFGPTKRNVVLTHGKSSARAAVLTLANPKSAAARRPSLIKASFLIRHPGLAEDPASLA